MNFAENLLRYRDEKTAIIFKGEGQAVERLSYSGLYRQVTRLALALRRAGVVQGDRVAGFLPNLPETVIAMLASVGFLAAAMRTLPLGTAYAVWTGIGTLGAFILGIVLLGEPASAQRFAAAGLILGGLVLMKLSA